MFNSESRRQSKELKMLLKDNRIRISRIRSAIFSLRKMFHNLSNPRSRRLLVFPYKMLRSDYVRQLRDARIQALIDRKDLEIAIPPQIIIDDSDCSQV